MDALLISYTTVDFRTKTEMELALRRWDSNKEKWLKKFKAAGMVSNINTQIWNKEGVFRIGRNHSCCFEFFKPFFFISIPSS